MNTTTSISMSNRIAAGVTAEYVLDLARHPASVPASAPARRDGHGPALRGHRIVAAALGRGRDDCGRTRTGRAVAV